MDKFLIIMNQTKDGVSAYLMRGGKIERNVDVKNDDLTEACRLATRFLLHPSDMKTEKSEKQYKEIKRAAKIGEYVKLVNDVRHFDCIVKKGQIFKVIDENDLFIKVDYFPSKDKACDTLSEQGKATAKFLFMLMPMAEKMREDELIIEHKDYVVLEGYENQEGSWYF